MRKAALGILVAMSVMTSNVFSQIVIAQWDFNAESLQPSLGVGTATLIGNVTSTFATGSSTDSGGTSNRALSIASFPSQGKGARTAGVQFAVDTTGYENIVVSWDQRFSSTASRRVLFQVSSDGENYSDAFFFDAPGEGWTNGVTVSLNNYADLANNALFVFRIVSDFFENSTYAPAKPGSSYSSAGTWRFDCVKITGSIIGEPAKSPLIIDQPVDLAVGLGADASFWVTSSGSEPLYYQWWFGDSPIASGTNSTLEVPRVSKANEGIYRVVVSNWVGSVTSAPAYLRVVTPPTIQFTNYLENLLRPGDSPTNTFSEFALNPGEILTTQICVSDSEGIPGLALIKCDPPTQGFSWTADPRVDATFTGTLRFIPSQNDLGQLFCVRLSAHNNWATNTVVWKVYVQTLKERNIVLTEYLANPPSSPGSPHYNPLQREQPAPNPTQQDEFIELVNLSNTEIDLQGWTISDSVQARHHFASSFTVASGGAVVIYGGPATDYRPNLEVPCIPANLNSGLSLNNNGDAIILRNADGHLICRVVYTSKMVALDGSMTRWPDANGPFVPHTTATQMSVSPGLRPDGQKWNESIQVHHVHGLRISFQPGGNLVLRWENTEMPGYTIWVAERIEGPFSPLVTEIKGSEYNIAVGPQQCRFYRISSP